MIKKNTFLLQVSVLFFFLVVDSFLLSHLISSCLLFSPFLFSSHLFAMTILEIPLLQGLKHRDLPTAVIHMIGLKVYTFIAQQVPLISFFFPYFFKNFSKSLLSFRVFETGPLCRLWLQLRAWIWQAW